MYILNIFTTILLIIIIICHVTFFRICKITRYSNDTFSNVQRLTRERNNICRLCFTALIISSFPMYTFQCAVTYISYRAAFCVTHLPILNKYRLLKVSKLARWLSSVNDVCAYIGESATL